MSRKLVPGALVRHPEEPQWGIGQVQSVVEDRVTVNFQHVGKQTINTRLVALAPVEDDRPRLKRKD